MHCNSSHFEEPVDIVATPENDPAFLMGQYSDVVSVAKRIKIATLPPSMVSSLSYFLKHHDELGIIDGRHIAGKSDDARTKEYPPISLQYEGFGHFLDIFRGRENVPGMDKVSQVALRTAVDQFAHRMSATYPARTDGQSFDLTSGSVSPNVVSDGHIEGPHHALYCITGFEDETGSCVEMSSYFAHSVRHAISNFPDSEGLLRGWNFPCLGLTIIGHHITFYAILSIGETQIVGLTPGLSCHVDAGEGDHRISLYAAFSVASVLLACVKEDATKLIQEPPPEIGLEHHVLFPVISSLPSPHSDSDCIDFTICDVFPGKVPWHYLYIAKTTDGKDISVKFTKSYSSKLHLICEENRCAPTLLGFKRFPSGFFGVAMEYIKDASLITDFPYDQRRAERLKELVEKFHAQNLVHGDLCSANIICTRERVAVISFDWAGELGQASYPPSELDDELTVGRNNTNMQITKEDDVRVLNQTLEIAAA